MTYHIYSLDFYHFYSQTCPKLLPEFAQLLIEIEILRKMPQIAEYFFFINDSVCCRLDPKLIFGGPNANRAILYQQKNCP